MLSIQGIYTGKEIKPLEYFHVQPNVRVIITFLENIDPMAPSQKDLVEKNEVPKSPTEVFLDKCGGWEDTRSAEEIITEMHLGQPLNNLYQKVGPVINYSNLPAPSHLTQILLLLCLLRMS